MMQGRGARGEGRWASEDQPAADGRPPTVEPENVPWTPETPASPLPALALRWFKWR